VHHNFRPNIDAKVVEGAALSFRTVISGPYRDSLLNIIENGARKHDSVGLVGPKGSGPPADGDFSSYYAGRQQ
jgi:hypothetical protein